ncbi:MAG: indolepyruvate ferredoxin oxidoreductase subunit alpha [Myxococcota bacterium]
MSYTIIGETCINCGACEFLCPTGAIRPPAPDAPHPPVFYIQTHQCNDCGVCPSVCPVDCILPDPDTFCCVGRGCPVADHRPGPFSGWECSRLEQVCPQCDHVLWRLAPSGGWICPRCDLDEDGRRALCPKVLSLERGKTGARAPRRSVAQLYEERTSEGRPGV